MSDATSELFDGDEDVARSAFPPRKLQIISMMGLNAVRKHLLDENGERVASDGDLTSVDYDVTVQGIKDATVKGVNEGEPAKVDAVETAYLPELLARYHATEAELVLIADPNDPHHKSMLEILERLKDDRVTIVVEPISVAVLKAERLDDLQNALSGVYDRLGRSDCTTVINLMPGIGLCKSILHIVGGFAGIDMIYGSYDDPHVFTIVEPPPLDLSLEATLKHVDMANWLVQRAELSGVDEQLERANAEGLASMVTARDGALHRSQLADMLLDRSLSTESRAYSFGAAILREFAHAETGHLADNAARLADRLEQLTGKWVDRRLWSLNLVPEMVLHDDRHVQRVERLAAMLAWPLLFERILEPQDIFDLSCASWLHDWGHVGAMYGRGSKARFVSHPLDVRLLHGELTRELIVTNPGQHELDSNEQLRVGMLCAHHQGKSSCTASPPVADNAMNKLATRLGRPLVSLAEAAGGTDFVESRGLSQRLGLPAEDDAGRLAKVQLLVGILRVADGADVGIHRIPHFDSKADYLRHCRQRGVSLSLSRIESIDPFHPSVPPLRAWLASPEDTQLYGEVVRVANSTHAERQIGPEMERIRDYVDYVDAQHEHYDKHKHVSMVRFEHLPEETSSGLAYGSWRALVRPTSRDGGRVQAAVDAVNGDIIRELYEGGDRSRPQPYTAIFDRVGLVYRCTVEDR